MVFGSGSGMVKDEVTRTRIIGDEPVRVVKGELDAGFILACHVF
jgi:hypothetical protein